MTNPNIKVAIADDQVLFLKGLKFIIETFDNIELVLEAQNGRQLLDKLKDIEVNIILMDLKMPVMDGMEATIEVRKLYPDVKVIFLSMHDDERLISHMMKIGASGYLLKNESPEVVRDAIIAVAEKGFYFNDYVSKALLSGLHSKNSAVDLKHHFKEKMLLTKRELEVLDLICRAYTTAEIGEKLFISKRTVEGHRKNLIEKTGVKNTAALIVLAIKNGLVELM
ncbi:MAG: response regulator transcription factor [Chitinophagales bacterium]|nr:response regulator transcription factor [Chitinophagales bacterium]